MKRLILSAIAAAGLMFTAQAQVPGTLSYQGILVDGTGAPVTDGSSHTVRFTFYDAPSSGAILHSTGTFNVTTFKGMFTTIIGNSVPSAGVNGPIPLAIWNVPVWVEVIADGVALTPLVQLTANAYAFKAESANTIIDNAITSVKIANGTIVAADLSTGSVNSTAILDGEIVNADINASAAIADSKLATITTAGKVSGSAITSGTISGALIGTGISATNISAGTLADARLEATVDVGAMNVGSAAQFVVNNSGNITKINNITTSFPASQGAANSFLTNNGSGTLSWATTLAGSQVGTGINASNVTTGTLPAGVIPSSVASGSGTAGQLGLWSGSNTLAGDANLFWDNTNKFLGLGTSSPNRRLSISGTGGVDNDALLETFASTLSASGTLRFTKARGTSGAPTTVLANDILGSAAFAGYTGATYSNAGQIQGLAETSFNSAVNGALLFNTTAGGVINEKMRLTSTGILGIGTTSPNNGLLHLAGTASVYNGIHFTSTATGAGITDGFLLGPTVANGLDLALFNSEGANLYLGTSNIARLTINAGGNIGLGVAPVNKLDVEGGAVIGATYSGTNVAPTNGLLVEGPVALGATSNNGAKMYMFTPNTDVTNPLGLFVTNNYGGTSTKYGSSINVSADGDGIKYGVDCNVQGLTGDPSTIYGLETDVTPNGTGTAFGVNSSIGAAGTGVREGVYSSSATLASNTSYNRAVYGSASGTGTGPHYGVYGTASGAGTNYGLYGSALGGTTNYAGYISGDLHVTADITYVGTISDVSDKKLKRDIVPLTNALDRIMKLKPSTYFFRTDEFQFLKLSKEKQIGLIAQDVEEVFPEIVNNVKLPKEEGLNGEPAHDDFEYKGVDYTMLIAPMIKSIQEQQTQIEDLKATIESLKSQLGQYQALSAQIEELKKLVTPKSISTSSNSIGSGSNK